MPFSFPRLSVGGGGGGKKVRFESEEFNNRFTVRTDNPKFASDVIHPRTMEFLMAVEPPDFRIEGDVTRFSVDRHDTQLIGFCADFAHEFFSLCRRSCGRTCRSIRRRSARSRQTESPSDRHSRAIGQVQVRRCIEHCEIGAVSEHQTADVGTP
jgi:hypothetical protein